MTNEELVNLCYTNPKAVTAEFIAEIPNEQMIALAGALNESIDDDLLRRLCVNMLCRLYAKEPAAVTQIGAVAMKKRRCSNG